MWALGRDFAAAAAAAAAFLPNETPETQLWAGALCRQALYGDCPSAPPPERVMMRRRSLGSLGSLLDACAITGTSAGASAAVPTGGSGAAGFTLRRARALPRKTASVTAPERPPASCSLQNLLAASDAPPVDIAAASTSSAPAAVGPSALASSPPARVVRRRCSVGSCGDYYASLVTDAASAQGRGGEQQPSSNAPPPLPQRLPRSIDALVASMMAPPLPPPPTANSSSSAEGADAADLGVEQFPSCSTTGLAAAEWCAARTRITPAHIALLLHVCRTSPDDAAAHHATRLRRCDARPARAREAWAALKGLPQDEALARYTEAVYSAAAAAAGATPGVGGSSGGAWTAAAAAGGGSRRSSSGGGGCPGGAEAASAPLLRAH